MEKLDSVIARLVGIVLLVIAVGSAALGALIVQRQLTFIERFNPFALGAIFFTLGLAVIFSTVGYRLAANRPNKYGSIFTPIGWYLLCALFAFLTLLLVFVAARKLDGKLFSVTLFTTVFAWWCYQAGKEGIARSKGITTPPENPFGPTPNSRKGYLRLMTLRGIPIYIHRSLPMGGMVFAMYAGFDISNVVYYCIGYIVLVVAHEAGHALAANLVGLKVFSVDITGAGGMCRIELPRTAAHGFVVYSAGLAVQLMLFVGTLICIAVYGKPETPFWSCIAFTLTVANAILFLFNLIPSNTSGGLATDGKVLWQLFLHSRRGHQSPFANYTPVSSDASPVFSPETTLLTMPALIPKGFKQGVEILNDKTTPMEFVVSCLTNHLGMIQEVAITTMIAIHNNGGILIPLSSIEDARRIAAAIDSDAKQQGHALVCRAVEVAKETALLQR